MPFTERTTTFAQLAVEIESFGRSRHVVVTEEDAHDQLDRVEGLGLHAFALLGAEDVKVPCSWSERFRAAFAPLVVQKSP